MNYFNVDFFKRVLLTTKFFLMITNLKSLSFIYYIPFGKISYKFQNRILGVTTVMCITQEDTIYGLRA
jgi:hypothetical protein